jgi:hypothetical protein
MDSVAAGILCARLADFALLALASGGTVTMHDVVRDYLRSELGATRLAELHRLLLDAVARDLPDAVSAGGSGNPAAWWKLPEDARYIREHLIEHMLAAERSSEAEEIATDLRWADARLRASGPAGASADLALVGTPKAVRLHRLLGQAAHLLTPTDPPQSLTDVLYSRASHDPDWGPQGKALAASRAVPALSPASTLPDLPIQALYRTLILTTGEVAAMTAAADGTWLATASTDGTVRTWDTATGGQRTSLTGHTDGVTAVVVSPDNTWLATAGRRVRIWDLATGLPRASLDKATGMSVTPDGMWLAATSAGGMIQILDPATGATSAAMRVDSTVWDCAWNSSGHLLAVAGDAGLYLFAFNS